MMLAIFIFLILILLLSSNVHVHIKSVNDTVKAYLKIGVFYVLIPHHKILSGILINRDTDLRKIKNDFAKAKKLTLNIFSHSILDHMYIAKFSKTSLLESPIGNGLFLILMHQFRGLLQSRFRFVDTNNIKLEYDPCYENVDYSIRAHISILNILCALVKTIFKR